MRKHFSPTSMLFILLAIGCWFTSSPTTRAEATGANAAEVKPAASLEKIAIITKGARVEIAEHLAKGKITVVDFYADWCGPCRVISPTLEKLANQDADVFLRKVNIVKWGSPVAEQYKINSIPRI